MTSNPPLYSISGAFAVAGGAEIVLDRPILMAVVNVTPDSFYSGSAALQTDRAVDLCTRALAEGALILDIGGESTRPGATPVPDDEQIRRVAPVLSAISPAVRAAGAFISIDTTRSAVARAALDAGASIINDVSAGLDDPQMFPLAAARRCGLILMHRLVAPAADSYSDRYTHEPAYTNVVSDVRDWLLERARAAQAAGVERASIMLDPGLGFGKSVEQNLALAARVSELVSAGYPVLSAASRKSFVGRAMGLEQSDPSQRLAGSLVFSVAMQAGGCRVFRVHAGDVAAHLASLRTAWRLRDAGV